MPYNGRQSPEMASLQLQHKAVIGGKSAPFAEGVFQVIGL
jgi:hypothetical protein